MHILDYQHLHSELPETFPIPSQEELHKIVPGDLVKICVEPERFWVRVETVQDNKVTGHIYSDMIHTATHGLRANDPIEFEKKNIYRINS